MHDFSLIQAPQIGGPGYQFPTVVATPPPNFDAPHDFLALALVTTSICAILNLVSLAFGIPAIVLSAMVSLFNSIRAQLEKSYHCIWQQKITLQAMSSRRGWGLRASEYRGMHSLD